MKPEFMDRMRDARDFCALTRGVLAACEPYGPVCVEIPVRKDFEARPRVAA